jgi:hypothetical protein
MAVSIWASVKSPRDEHDEDDRDLADPDFVVRSGPRHRPARHQVGREHDDRETGGAAIERSTMGKGSCHRFEPVTAVLLDDPVLQPEDP